MKQAFGLIRILLFHRHNKTPKVFCLTFGVHVKFLTFEGFVLPNCFY